MNQYVLLAKQTVENYLIERKIIAPPTNLPKEFLEKRAGVFVTIEKCASSAHPPMRRELRGCIGTYLPTKINIAEEIINNAIAAATEDYRFEPIKKDDIPYLSYTIYVLSEPELIENINELNPKKFGIIVKTAPFAFPNEDPVFDGNVSSKTGLLLPDLEGINVPEEQFSIACQKAGINPEKEEVFIYRFIAEKYEG
ncbi:MAG: AMMECR1 domain-containing protein [Candidatus Pacebacteria bacterium]|nr:AMMECR1 domain-containing protein [Candidatus Paceibacterota bacterium]